MNENTVKNTKTIGVCPTCGKASKGRERCPTCRIATVQINQNVWRAACLKTKGSLNRLENVKRILGRHENGGKGFCTRCGCEMIFHPYTLKFSTGDGSPLPECIPARLG